MNPGYNVESQTLGDFHGLAMIGRLCMTSFVGLMALGATCEDRGSIDMVNMRVDIKAVANCIDPRKIDLKKGFNASCETIANILGVGPKKYGRKKDDWFSRMTGLKVSNIDARLYSPYTHKQISYRANILHTSEPV